MTRARIAALALLAAAPIALDPARAQAPDRSPVAPAPAALRRFEGHLRGTFDARVREAGVSGLLLRVTRVEPRPGGPKIDGRSVIGKPVCIALPQGEGTSEPMGLFLVYQQPRPRQEVRIRMHVDPESRLLVAQEMEVLVPPRAAPA